MSLVNPIQQLLDTTQKVRELKLKKYEFQGLGNELASSQIELMAKYNRSKGMKHTRDLGNRREEILRKYLLKSNLIPSKCRISQLSSRVTDTNGNYSRELDILLSNNDENIILMKRGESLEVHPIENTYGTIQVKSKFNLKELKSAFENIASYKKLRKNLTDQKPEHSNEGFGVIFFYITDMTNLELTDHINNVKAEYTSDLLPNAIFILNHGHFLPIYQNQTLLLTDAIKEVTSDNINYYCNPNHNDHLYHFHNILLYLLRKTRISLVEISSYYNIGNIDFSSNISFKFDAGEFLELAICKKHRSPTEVEYLREINSQNLEKIFQNIATSQFVDEGLLIANRQSSSLVKVYNPENLELQKLLKYENGFLAYEKITINKLGNKFHVLLPHYYIQKENLFEDCPQCKKNEKTKANRALAKLKP
ncbi:hypothetical protein MJ004_06975 [Acinetobacter junii]|uniref:DUF6602 domain-containing protein n=3 Tax=Acinetobacter junii TaxID=40215 RepID=UPI0022EA4EE7|nr:DUF6602 domain-containing protein [Acinetobacter junii]MDA3507480.1 hypothetical protein [Acinetobacter junii]MDA3532479.1 hypothetical protein [Acinetobacter junii]